MALSLSQKPIVILRRWLLTTVHGCLVPYPVVFTVERSPAATTAETARCFCAQSPPCMDQLPTIVSVLSATDVPLHVSVGA